MFPIASLEDVKKLAELQNNLGTIAIQRNDLNHRHVKYRSFRIALSPELDGEEALQTYFSTLNFFSRTVVTSVSRYHADELLIAVPVVSGLIIPFGAFPEKDRVYIELDIMLRETLQEAAKNILDTDKLIGAIVSYHWRNEYSSPLFEGRIEGNFFKTIVASVNRITWPRWSPKNEFHS